MDFVKEGETKTGLLGEVVTRKNDNETLWVRKEGSGGGFKKKKNKGKGRDQC